jgi:hypothetical protein
VRIASTETSKFPPSPTPAFLCILIQCRSPSLWLYFPISSNLHQILILSHLLHKICLCP